MLIRLNAPARQLAEPEDIQAAGHVRRARSPRAGSPRALSVITFTVAAAATVAYALPGGAYDVVTRQEYAIVIWCGLGLAVACGLLPRARPARPIVLVMGALVAYAGWVGLSLIWTESSERTTAEVARVLDYLGLLAVIAFTVDRRNWRTAVLGLGFGALVVCALAVASRLFPFAFPASQRLLSRLSYPFGYWNAVGAWGAMTTALALAWSVHDRIGIRRSLALGLAPLAVLATYLSYSRGSVIAGIVAVVVVVAVSRHRLIALIHAAALAGAGAVAILAVRAEPAIANGNGTSGRGAVIAAVALAVALGAAAALVTLSPILQRTRVPRRVTRVLAAATALVLAVLAVAFGPSLATRAWHDFRGSNVVSSSDPAARLTQLSGTRYDYWRTALADFTAHPVIGTGAGTFEFFSDRYPKSREFVRNAHSLELENLAELGVPGLALILLVLAAGMGALVAFRRRCRRSVSAGAATAAVGAFVAYLVQASVDWMWQVTAVTALALAAVAVGSARLAGPRPRLRWHGRAAVLAVAVIAALIQVPGALSTSEVRRSQAAERAGNASLALSWANAAVSAEPWAASAYEQRGLVLEAGGQLARARADLERAIAQEHTNFRHWLLLARIDAERGDAADAIREYEQARRLRPRAVVFQYSPPTGSAHPAGQG